MKEKVLRNTQIRNLHEMGEIQRAQEQRIDEVSVQKLREIHETIQQLTSQLQQMQEQMISMDDSGDFLVEGCLTFPVNLYGINLDYRKTFLVRLIHPEIILKEFNLTTCKETGKQSLKP